MSELYPHAEMDEENIPIAVMDADSFLRHALFKSPPPDPFWYCHTPILIHDSSTKLGNVLHRFTVHDQKQHDDVIEQDIVLLWGDCKRIITGADILGRLMQGISKKTVY